MKKMVIVLLLIMTALFPTSVFAVDFSIPEVRIDAYLGPDGDVKVVEQHTYEFNGEFNGIIRELFAKNKSAINSFEAFENGKALEVERNNGEYRVHRKGNDETIVIELRYDILNGIEKYEDGAQFYWPFFDNRNESDYGNMMITIHPPDAAKNVHFLGYDSAYGTGRIESAGVVSFKLGSVFSGENGDIRVIYEPDLFPDVPGRNGMILDELVADENRLAEEIDAFSAQQEQTMKYGNVGLTLAMLAIVGLFSTMISRKRIAKRGALYQLTNDKFSVPVERMSMPAVIYYTNGKYFIPGIMAAALLDLVRKGHVLQESDKVFKLLNRNVEHAHEKGLINLLFSKAGDGVHFKMDDLEQYTAKQENHISYNESVAKWHEDIKLEVANQDLDGENKVIRSSLALVGFGLAFGALFFFLYDVFTLFLTAALFSIITLLTAYVYKPRNEKGHLVLEEWLRLRKVFDASHIDEWNKLSTNDKFKVYTYAVGSNDKNFSKEFRQFADAGRRMTHNDTTYMYYDPYLMSSSFTIASTNATPISSDSSSDEGGTGGGGGGSGAF